MKKLIVSMFIVLGGVSLSAPAFADDSTPTACAVDSEGNETCATIEPNPIDVIDEPTPIDAPDCSVDMSVCQRGVIMYDKVGTSNVLHNDTHVHETWWDIFTDPRHIAAEIGWTVIQDVLIIGLLYGFVFKKCILPKLTNRIHAEIDKEHGIKHE